VLATRNSTGTITYSVTGGCSNVGATVTITSGTTACVVTANVAADNNYNAGSVSGSTNASKVNPTVGWTTAPPASAAYNSQFTVLASSNSSGAISYNTTGGCSNLGPTVTMTSGTTACVVTANVAADSNYNAGSVTGTAGASKATATVTLSSTTQTYTGTALTPTVTTSPANLGITWSNAPQTNAGAYSVTATINDPNYAGSVGGSFNINKAPLTITADNKSMAQGGSVPPLTATYTGLVGGDQPAVAPVNLTTTATSSSPAGTYPIYFNGAPTTANYTITTVNGVLTVTAAGTARIVGTAVGHGAGYVDVSFANTGTADATNINITSVTVKVLTGTGTIAYTSPALPYPLGTTLLQGSANAVVVRLYVTLTGTVQRYSIAEVGSYTDTSTKAYSTSQTVLNP